MAINSLTSGAQNPVNLYKVSQNSPGNLRTEQTRPSDKASRLEDSVKVQISKQSQDLIAQLAAKKETIQAEQEAQKVNNEKIMAEQKAATEERTSGSNISSEKEAMQSVDLMA